MRFILTAFLTTAALAGDPAWGHTAVRAQATLTGLEFKLIDLAPDDGIEPYVRWTRHPFLTHVVSYVGLPTCIDDRSLCDYRSSDELLAPLSVSTAGRGGTASATISPEGWFMSMTASSWDRPGYARGIIAGGSIQGDSSTGEVLTLSPHTALSVTGLYSLHAQADAGAGENDRYVFARIGAKSWQHDFADSVSFLLDGTAQEMVKSGEFNWYLENTQNVEHAKRGFLSLGAGTVPPIPEPSSWLLMMAGLALTGITARRRLNAWPLNDA